MTKYEEMAKKYVEERGLSLVDMAKGFARAAWRFAASGGAVASPTVRAARAAECLACPFWKVSKVAGVEFGRCSVCGCVALKPWSDAERCPQGRWKR